MKITNAQLAKSIDELAHFTKQGFDAMDQRFNVVEKRLDSIGSDVQILKRHASLTDARVERLELAL